MTLDIHQKNVQEILIRNANTDTNWLANAIFRYLQVERTPTMIPTFHLVHILRVVSINSVILVKIWYISNSIFTIYSIEAADLLYLRRDLIPSILP